MENQITRYQLYMDTYKYIGEFKNYFKSNKLNEVTDMYYSSALLIKDMENNIEKNNTESFNSLFQKNFNNIDGQNLKEYIQKYFINKNSQYKKKTLSFLDEFKELLKVLVKYQNKILNKNFIFNKKEFDYMDLSMSEEQGLTEKRVRTFLSYAFTDKAFTFSLYVYFYKHNGYLYVDWMHESALKTGIEIKKSLEKNLNNCQQFLFLRSINSELSSDGRTHIRQWCAWEIGNYYTKGKDSKFIIDLYEIKTTKNDLLDNFKKMLYVDNGIIIY